jgi:hypothetical protein
MHSPDIEYDTLV